MEDERTKEANGQAPVRRKRNWEGLELVAATTSNGWEQERLDANSLLRSLHEDHVENETDRKFLLERWPQWSEENLRGSIPHAERFIAESLLRDQDFDAIKNLVSRSIGRLGQQCPDEEEEDLGIYATISRLSDEGVLEALPKYLPRLQGKALCSVLSVLSMKETKAKNVPWLIKRINEEWKKLNKGHSRGYAPAQISRKLLAVFRDPKSFRKEVPPVKFVIEASSPLTAAYSALSQLEKLPLKCLQVMFEILVEKPLDGRIGQLPVGGNKDHIMSHLVSNFSRLLSDHQPGEALPALVQRALVVVSVSARFALGHDGNLMNFLEPIPSEQKALHDRLLTALTDLKGLNHDNLEQVYCELSGKPMLQDKRHSLVLRQPTRNVILDCLLRSEVRSVPENVNKVLTTITNLARKQVEGQGNTSCSSRPERSLPDHAKIEQEVEAVLVLSSHMQQIMFNWNELASDNLGRNHHLELSTVNCKNQSELVENTSGWLSDDEGVGLDHRECPEGRSGGHLVDSVRLKNNLTEGEARQEDRVREEGTLRGAVARAQQRVESHTWSPVEEKEIHGLTRIADETSEVGYTLVGCAMEKIATASGVTLDKRVRNYLRGEMMMASPTCPESDTNTEQNQLEIILSIAESIPGISSRTMRNVKRRLGVG